MKHLFFVGLFFLISSLLMVSCNKDNNDDPNNDGDLPVVNNSTANLVFKFKFDPNQVRLNNIGLPAELPANHAGQNPNFNSISAHYVELAPSPFTLLGEGAVLYTGPETEAGGEKAIDFKQAMVVAENEVFLSIPINTIAAGNYEYLRVSLSYQNYDINFKAFGLNQTGTLASFIGYNNYIESYTIKSNSVTVNGNRKQGYWGFDNTFSGAIDGQAPEGAVTVPNPLFNSSPIPQGSCIVTGPFANGLTITGEETEDVNVTISLSTKDSFEWIDDGDGEFEPLDGEAVVDMGIRGLVPVVE